MIDGRNFFDQFKQIAIRRIVIGQADDYTTRCLLDSLFQKLL